MPSYSHLSFSPPFPGHWQGPIFSMMESVVERLASFNESHHRFVQLREKVEELEQVLFPSVCDAMFAQNASFGTTFSQFSCIALS